MIPLTICLVLLGFGQLLQWHYIGQLIRQVEELQNRLK